MSQPSKQVDWCLKKAEREIEEGRRIGQRNPKHRGLIKKHPDQKEAADFIEKAAENLNFAISLDSSKHGDTAISSLFYCMYHCFLAIASKFGYESRNQTCTIALMAYLKEEGKIDLDNRFIEMFKYKEDQEGKEAYSLIEMREEYTYGSKTAVGKHIINELVKDCQRLIEDTKNIVHFNA
ncbi:hypothetical protein A3K73_05765 [Candidatus Pacearchaeota archaeon RBG_13_36_9]|nr:MAG: hypothetical protein A3K73_05765 [Candidatus Pacearchaeota archaeon RBG_13_36_9]